jgi:hypothetical protein
VIPSTNHKVLVPSLTNGDDHAGDQFRRAVTAEAALFGLVLALTAVLVASSARLSRLGFDPSCR